MAHDLIILDNRDTGSAVRISTTDGSVLASYADIPGGIYGDAIAGSGIFAVAKENPTNVSSFELFTAARVSIASVTTPFPTAQFPLGTPVRAIFGGHTFYGLGYSGSAGNPAPLYAFSDAGVVGSSWNLPAVSGVNVTAVCPAQDESIAYYYVADATSAAIKRWDLVNNIGLADFATAPTLSGHTTSPNHDIITMPSGHVIVTWGAGTGFPSSTQITVYDASGSIVAAIAVTHYRLVTGCGVRLCPDLDDSAYFWALASTDSGGATCTLTRYKLSDGSVSKTFTLAYAADLGGSGSVPSGGMFMVPAVATTPPPVSFTPVAVTQDGTCNPQSTVSSGGKGQAGCNSGGLGWTSSYTGPYGSPASHADPSDGESLANAPGVDAWIDLVHTDYPSGDQTTYRRASVELGDLDTYEGGRKAEGVQAIGSVEHALGNEVQGFEAATVDIQYADASDRLVRDLMDTQDLEGDELTVKLATSAGRNAGTPPKIAMRAVIQQAQLASPMGATLTAVDALFADYGPLGPNRQWPRSIPALWGTSTPPDASSLALPWLYGEKSDEGAIDPLTNAPHSKGLCPLIYVGQESIGRQVTQSAYAYSGISGESTMRNAGTVTIAGSGFGTVDSPYKFYAVAAVFADGTMSGAMMKDNTLRFPGQSPSVGPPYDERVVWDLWDPSRTDITGFLVFQYDAETGWDPLTNPGAAANPRYKLVAPVVTNPSGPPDIPGQTVNADEPWAYSVDWSGPTDGDPWPPTSGSVVTLPGETWDVYLAFGHPIFRMIALYGTDNGNGDPTAKHDRVRIDVDARNGSDILVPWASDGSVSPYWPFATTYHEYTADDGTVYWLTVLYVKPDSPLSVDAKAGTVTMAGNFIGVEAIGDGTGLPLIDAEACKQHWLENPILADWTSGAWATNSVYPQWSDNTAKVRTSSFATRQTQLAALYGGRGITVGWYQGTSQSVTDLVALWNQATESMLGVNAHGQLFDWGLDETVDASAWPILDHVTDLFGPVTRVPGQARENVVSGSCDWDPDADKFRVAAQTFSSASGIQIYKGHRKAGDNPLDSIILNDKAQHAWILQRRLKRLQYGTALVEVTGTIGLLDYDVGDGILLTSLEGTGSVGYVARPFIITRRRLNLSSHPVTVTYTLWDVLNVLASTRYPNGIEQLFVLDDETSAPRPLGDEAATPSTALVLL